VLKQWLCGNFSAREPGDGTSRQLLAELPVGKPIFYHFFQTPDEIKEELLGSGLQITARRAGLWALKPENLDSSVSVLY
jgi:hypothetical protein